MDTVKIGKFIRELREEKGLTQSELAEKLNINYKTISRWENGNYLPPIEMMVELSKFFDVSVVEILNGERIKEEKEFRKRADESVTLSIATIFTLKDRMKFYAKKWLKENWIPLTLITVLSIVAALIELFGGNIIASIIFVLIGVGFALNKFDEFKKYMDTKLYDLTQNPVLEFKANEENDQNEKKEN